MTVAELIEFLQTQPQDRVVVHKMYSEFLVLDKDAIEVLELLPPREDGWVHRSRPDKDFQVYLVLPGN